ncbi:High-affinity potassium transport protein [Cytospora mali]|uniref:Potassium transport protein n=1 Tax=Cytospora mali TaxID=578113 RepID=A0A194UVV6_CYTMA|nr:High-affinity potassium transport protein [Valsa mali var. pyri (nom. inval.)]
MARRRAWSPRWCTELLVTHPQAAQLLREVRAFLPPLNFITIHYAYFIVVTLITSLIFWGSSNPDFSICYADSLFLTVSAMTEAGLNTVNLSQMTTWQQILLWLLIVLGSAIWVSIWTVAFRLRAFEKHFEDIVRAERGRREKARLKRPGSSTGVSVPFFRTVTFGKSSTTPAGNPTLAGTGTKVTADGGSTGANDTTSTIGGRRTASLPDLDRHAPGLQPSHAVEQNVDDANGGHDAEPATTTNSRITFADDTVASGMRDGRTTSAYATEARLRRRNVDDSETKEEVEDGGTSHMHHFLNKQTVGRNAQFHDLTAEERKHLGGCEYRALRVLSVIVPLYFVLWQFLGCISLGAWIAYNRPDAATSNSINPWWAGIFFGASAFNNSGMALLDANVIPFQDSYFVLIVMGAMILAGNTAYPIFLRFIVWSMLKLLCRLTTDDALCDFKETLRFILKYPRRVYTNMFPARQTWWLLFMVVLLNMTDWVAFELLNFGNPVIEGIPISSRVIDGLFQAIAVRSGGFYVVPISEVYIGLQIMYVIMMYISVYPVVITMRHSNVYEERSLGIYADDPEPALFDLEQGNAQGLGAQPQHQLQLQRTNSTQRRRDATTTAKVSRALKRHFAWHGVGVQPRWKDEPESRISFISQQVQGQLAHDIWWLVLAVLVISTIETSHFLGDPATYSVFNIIFEIVSAYGTVGISVGLPNASYSFAGGWHTASKIVLCLVMLRGRHRGLPVALDRAVRLPGEQLYRDEEEDNRIRRSITSRRMSVESHGQ